MVHVVNPISLAAGDRPTADDLARLPKVAAPVHVVGMQTELVDPHDMANAVIYVDPGYEGADGRPVRLGELTPQNVEVVLSAGNSSPAPLGQQAETLLSEEDGREEGGNPAAVVQTISPLEAFSRTTEGVTAKSGCAGEVVEPQTPSGSFSREERVGPPRVLVTFEVENLGKFEAYYHDVVTEPGFIVLVYDRRHQGSMRYFPPAAAPESAPVMAVHVQGSGVVQQVHTTGIQFVHADREYCLLLVEREAALPGSPASPASPVEPAEPPEAVDAEEGLREE